MSAIIGKIEKKKNDRVTELQKELEKLNAEEKVAEIEEHPSQNIEEPIRKAEKNLDSLLETKMSGQEALKLIIENLALVNSRGCFDLEESKDIFVSINSIGKEGNSPEDVTKCMTVLINAIKIANKRGKFSFEESYKIYNICSVFFLPTK